jgi:two-component system response regulator NreC
MPNGSCHSKRAEGRRCWSSLHRASGPTFSLASANALKWLEGLHRKSAPGERPTARVESPFQGRKGGTVLPIKVMLVDDHDIVRTGLRMMLDAEPDLEVVAEAKSGEEALGLIAGCRPDLIIMDVSMPGMGGPAATRVLRERCPDIPILALTIHEDERYFFQMLDAGAAGYLPKRAAPTDLVDAIHTVHQGHVYLYPSLATALVGDYLQRAETESDERRSYDELTSRQRQVLTLIAEGVSNADIAESLAISVKTVARHRENIMARLNLHSRAELIKYAIRKGLTEV